MLCQCGMDPGEKELQGALQEQEKESAETDAQFKPGKEAERIFMAVGGTAQEPAAQSESEEKCTQYGADGQRCVAEYEAEYTRPNHFIEQPDKSGKKEEHENKDVHKPAV